MPKPISSHAFYGADLTAALRSLALTQDRAFSAKIFDWNVSISGILGRKQAIRSGQNSVGASRPSSFSRRRWTSCSATTFIPTIAAETRAYRTSSSHFIHRAVIS